MMTTRVDRLFASENLFARLLPNATHIGNETARAEVNWTIATSCIPRLVDSRFGESMKVPRCFGPNALRIVSKVKECDKKFFHCTTTLLI